MTSATTRTANHGVPALRTGALLSSCIAAIVLLDCTQAPADRDSAYIRANYTKHEYRIQMRDGARMYTIAYVPKDASRDNRYPILINRTPFSVAPYGTEDYPRTLGPNPIMTREKYIFVYQDVRGRYMSEGKWVDMRPFVPDSVKARNPKMTDEASDTYDTIDWLLKNVPDNNGKVGLWGISYGGFYTSLGMLSRHPALVASSPQAPVTDVFFEDFHHNGALTQAYFYAYPIFGVPRPDTTRENWWLPQYDSVAANGTTNDYAYQLTLGPLKNTTTRFYKNNTFWQELVAHPNYDSFWQSRAVPPDLRGVKQAVLIVGGWFDAEDLYGPLAVYKTLKQYDRDANTTIVMGPFRHRGWAAQNVVHTMRGDVYYGDSLEAKYQRDVEAPFFRTYLKGQGKLDLPGALMFDTGLKQWKRYDRWPVASAAKREYYFHADGSLTTSAPSERQSFREYVSDPAKPVRSRCAGQTIEDFTLDHYMSDDQRCFDSDSGVLTFRTNVLDQDVTLGGEIDAKLKVSTTGTDGDYVVKLIDVYPSTEPDSPYQPDPKVHMAGYQQLVRGEIMRARFRKSFAAPEPMVPTQITDVEFRLQDILHTFRKGHRIMVQVQSSWFPAFDRNPQKYVANIFEADSADFIRATERVWTSRDAASGIEVIVVGGAQCTTPACSSHSTLPRGQQY